MLKLSIIKNLEIYVYIERKRENKALESNSIRCRLIYFRHKTKRFNLKIIVKQIYLVTSANKTLQRLHAAIN